MAIINSFSKYFCMTTWRLGWMVLPQARMREFEKVAQHLFICAPTIAHHAALVRVRAGIQMRLSLRFIGISTGG